MCQIWHLSLSDCSFVGREARIALVLMLYVHRKMYVEFWIKKKKIGKKHRYFNGCATLTNRNRHHKTTAYQDRRSYQKQNWPIKPPRTLFWKCSDQARTAHLSSLFVTVSLWHLGVAMAITSRRRYNAWALQRAAAYRGHCGRTETFGKCSHHYPWFHVSAEPFCRTWAENILQT